MLILCLDLPHHMTANKLDIAQHHLQASVLVWAVRTKHCRQGGLHDKHLFLNLANLL